jgi:hypothetical protein
MTDKQIIKHNVNVSKCEFLGFPRSSKAYCVCDSSELSDICDENPNCYYKQLKRKEQEVDILKAERDSYIDKYFLESQKVLSLRKGLKEIKEIIHFNKNNRLSGGACISIEQILQKISEVEDG